MNCPFCKSCDVEISKSNQGYFWQCFKCEGRGPSVPTVGQANSTLYETEYNKEKS